MPRYNRPSNIWFWHSNPWFNGSLEKRKLILGVFFPTCFQKKPRVSEIFCELWKVIKPSCFLLSVRERDGQRCRCWVPQDVDLETEEIADLLQFEDSGSVGVRLIAMMKE